MLKPEYCIWPDVKSCKLCSLVNYGMDCRNNPIHGGKRINSGRKVSEDPRKTRSIKFTDAEWDHIKKEAFREEITASEYIRNKIFKN